MKITEIEEYDYPYYDGENRRIRIVWIKEQPKDINEIEYQNITYEVIHSFKNSDGEIIYHLKEK